MDPVCQFKFACPVCGQHLQARPEEAGKTTECPSCFKKLTVPQAPANGGGNLIIAAALAESRRTVPLRTDSQSSPGAKRKVSPGLKIYLIAALLAVLAAVAGLMFLPQGDASDDSSKGETAQWWTDNFDELQLRDTPVVGQLNGWDFEATREIWRGTQLILRQNGGTPAELRLEVTFPLVGGELIPGKTWQLRVGDPPFTVPVRMLWKDELGVNQSLAWPSGYLLWVRFDAVTKKKVSGRIHICLPDPARSWVAGSFDAEVKTVLK